MVFGADAVLAGAMTSREQNRGWNPPPASNAIICAQDPVLRDSLFDLCELAGVGAEECGDSPPPPVGRTAGPTVGAGLAGALLLAEVGHGVPVSLGDLPRVNVAFRSAEGQGRADIVLPGDEAELVHLLAGWVSEQGNEAGAGKVLLVAAWHGGGGATSCSFALARALGAVVLDASGNGGGPIPLDGAPVWEALEEDDLPAGQVLVRSLPRQGTVPFLTALHGVPPTPRSKIVGGLIPRLTGVTVVDCGTDLHGLSALAQQLGGEADVVLVGRTDHDGVQRLGRGLTTLAPLGTLREALLLQVGGSSALVADLAARHGAQALRAPSPTRPRAWSALVRRQVRV